MGDELWTDYTVEFRAKSNRYFSQSYGIIFKYTNNYNYYSLMWTQGRAASFFERLTDQKLFIGKNSINTAVAPTITYNLPVSISIFEWQKYKIQAKGDTIKVYLNDISEPILTYKDETPIPTGKIGFGVYGNSYSSTEAYFDDVKVYKN
jgi:hypothetical protein